MKRHPIPPQFRTRHPHPCDGNLPPELNAALQQHVVEIAEGMVELSRGETLVHSGMPFKYLYLVVNGGLKAVQIGEDGQSQIVCFHYPRELVGLTGFARNVYTTDVVALAPSLVCEFPGATLESIVSADRALLDHFLSYVSESLARAERDQFMLGSLTAPQKIAYFLLQLQDKLRLAGKDADRFELLMTREEIGSYLGLTMETISRLFSQLQADGVARVEKRQVQILRHDLLQLWRDEGAELATPSRKKSPVLKLA